MSTNISKQAGRHCAEANLPPSLFSSRHVALASFLGMPLGGSILMAMNYFRLKQHAAAMITIVAGFATSFLILLIASTMPFELPTGSGLLIGAVYAFAMKQIADAFQKRDIEQAVIAGAKPTSMIVAAMIGCASLIVSFGGFVCVLFLVAS